MTYLPRMGYFPTRGDDPGQAPPVPCPSCGGPVYDYGDGLDCDHCEWTDGETDRALDTARDDRARGMVNPADFAPRRAA